MDAGDDFSGFAEDLTIDGLDGDSGKKKKPEDEKPPNVDDSLSQGSE